MLMWLSNLGFAGGDGSAPSYIPSRSNLCGGLMRLRGGLL